MKFMLTRKIKTLLASVLCFTLLFTTFSTQAYAKGTDSNKLSFDLGNGIIGNLTIEENEQFRTVEYYENDKMLQISVLDKKTGDVYYYDLKELELSGNAVSDMFLSNNTKSTSYTTKYNVNDFVDETIKSLNHLPITNQNIVNTSSSYTLVKSLFYNEFGDSYSRYLYGTQGEQQDEVMSWHFVAGIALSVIIVAVGYLPGVNTLIVGAVGIVGGAILSSLTIKEWVKEFYWKYRFLQTSPTHLSFDCRDKFVYHKQRRVQVNGDYGYWETFYSLSNSQIDSIRTQILQHPGLFM